MRRLMLSLGLGVLLLSPSLALADLRIPDKEKKKEAPVRLTKDVTLTITYLDDKAKDGPRLVIPKKFMVAVGDIEHAPLAQAPSRTLFIGLACSAALVTGGLWFVRRSGKGARGILALFVVSSVLGAAAFVPQLFGNGGIPPRILPKVEITGKNAKIAVDVVVVSEGDRMELFLPGALAPTAPVPVPEAKKE